jgi:hypothetical protein
VSSSLDSRCNAIHSVEDHGEVLKFRSSIDVGLLVSVTVSAEFPQ